MSSVQYGVCPHCGSAGIYETDGLIHCSECPFTWKQDLKWISRITASMFHNIGWTMDRKLSKDEQTELSQLLASALKRLNSAKNITEADPKSALTLYLSALEEITMGIKKMVSPFIEKSFLFLHEVKMFAYYDSPPDNLDHRKYKYDKDEIFLFIDLSGKKHKTFNPFTEKEFFKIEDVHGWKNTGQRYGALYRAGKYFRSTKWTEFCKKEITQLQLICQDLVLMFGLLVDRQPPGLLMTTRSFGDGRLEYLISRKRLHREFMIRQSVWGLLNVEMIKLTLKNIGNFLIGDDLLITLRNKTQHILDVAIWRANENKRRTIKAIDV